MIPFCLSKGIVNLCISFCVCMCMCVCVCAEIKMESAELQGDLWAFNYL